MTYVSIKMIEDQVFKILEKRLSPDLKYHSLEHTKYVLYTVKNIAKQSNVSDSELFLLQIAALYHDIGFINVYQNHEEEGCKIATEQLRFMGFQDEEIQVICGMIMATQIPQTPTNRLEEILADADLEYLGTLHFEEISQKLYLELKIRNPEMTLHEWNTLQINFIEKHHYFTNFCIKNREHIKLENLHKLKKSL